MGLKDHVFDQWNTESGLKIYDFLSSHNQHLKLNIFTPLQQIPCYCKSRLGTPRLISWWRVTNDDPVMDETGSSCRHSFLPMSHLIIPLFLTGQSYSMTNVFNANTGSSSSCFKSARKIGGGGNFGKRSKQTLRCNKL